MPRRRRTPRPRSAGPAQAVLEFRCASGDWAAALAALDRNSRYGLIDKADYKRQRAVLLTAQALAAEDGDRDRRAHARARSRQARAGAGAGGRACRAAAGRGRRIAPRQPASSKRPGQANPHPDLADTYAHLRPGDSARERLARVQPLAQKAPGHAEGALAVARAALDAQEFAIARAARPAAVEASRPSAWPR